MRWHKPKKYFGPPMPKVVLPEGFVPPSAAVIGATQATERAFEVARLRQAIRCALDELGVPGPGYPAPVANAVGILQAALIDGHVCSGDQCCEAAAEAWDAEHSDGCPDPQDTLSSGLSRTQCPEQIDGDAGDG